MSRPSLNAHVRHATVTIVLVMSTAVLGVVATGSGSAGASGLSQKYYVSLGDSYSVGYQPSPEPGATNGYTGVVARKTHLVLKNFGCGGATTSSILHQIGCISPYGPPAATDRVAYPTQTQAAAAEAFIRRHKGEVGLITVSIGGNDVTACAAAANPISCVGGVMTTLGPNVTTLAEGLRAAAGKTVPIIGITYPDVVLGAWVYPPSDPDQSLATVSVSAFETLINPALEKAYAAAGAKFVDITADTGAYDPLTMTTTLAPYGTIPAAVAEVCELTWYCQLGNIHAKTVGYQLIGKEILAAEAKTTH